MLSTVNANKQFYQNPQDAKSTMSEHLQHVHKFKVPGILNFKKRSFDSLSFFDKTLFFHLLSNEIFLINLKLPWLTRVLL